MRLNYEDDVIREKVAGPPFLLDGESVELNGKIGTPASIVIVSIILTVVPPFFWGVLLFFIVRYIRRTSGYWVTDRRIVYWTKVPFSKQFSVQSAPLEKVSRVRRTPLSTSFVTKLFDRMMGVDDIQIFVNDSSIVQMSLLDVKKPSELLGHLKRRVGNKDN